MIRVIKKYAKLLDAHQKSRIFILFLFMLVGAFLEIMGVSMMLPLLTAVMQPVLLEKNIYVSQFCKILGIHQWRSFLMVSIVCLISVFIIKDLFIIIEYYIQYCFVYNNRFKTQKKVLNAYMHKPYEYFLHADSGEIIRVIGSDVSNTYLLLSNVLVLITELTVAAALLITVFVISPGMTVMLGLLMGVMSLFIVKVVKPKLRKQGEIYRKHDAATSKWLMQAINGIKEIKVSRREEFFESNYYYSGEKLIKAEKYNSVLQNIPRLIIEMGSVCSMLGIVGVMIYKGVEVQTLIPVLGAFAMATVRLLPSANRIVSVANSVAFYEPALDNVLDILEVLNEIENAEGVLTQNEEKLTIAKEIILQNVTYSYPKSDSKVLEHASMTIPVGASVGIVGSSGAGKTTVVDIILCLLNPQEGQVLSDGIDVRTAYSAWLSHIGYIPQMIFMLDASIRENVAFGMEEKGEKDEQVWKALEEAQLAEFVRSLPEGLDTKIGERGIRLSGGQRQRIGIARALYTDPELLIFDEATSALDNETEAAIMESINSLHGKKTMIIIAHRLTTIEGCDMVYRVEERNIVKESEKN